MIKIYQIKGCTLNDAEELCEDKAYDHLHTLTNLSYVALTWEGVLQHVVKLKSEIEGDAENDDDTKLVWTENFSDADSNEWWWEATLDGEFFAHIRAYAEDVDM